MFCFLGRFKSQPLPVPFWSLLTCLSCQDSSGYLFINTLGDIHAEPGSGYIKGDIHAKPGSGYIKGDIHAEPGSGYIKGLK